MLQQTIIIVIVSFLTVETSARWRIISPRETASTIQYGYRKCRTHARVFSWTLVHGDSKNEIEEDGIIIIAVFDRRDFYHFDHVSQKKVPFSMAKEIGNSCTSVFPNTHEW